MREAHDDSMRPVRFDVSDVLGQPASLAATYYPARTDAARVAVLLCLPGGTYSREYWDLSSPTFPPTSSPPTR